MKLQLEYQARGRTQGLYLERSGYLSCTGATSFFLFLQSSKVKPLKAPSFSSCMAAPPRASGLLTINNSYISHRRAKTSASLAAICILISPLMISPLIYQRVSGWYTGMFLYLLSVCMEGDEGQKNIICRLCFSLF